MVQLPLFIVFLIASTVLSIWYGLLLTRRPVSQTRTVVKTMPVFLLAMAALSLDEPFLLIGGLFLGSIGDAFLSRNGDKAFLLGLGSFLLGHLAFAVLFFQSGTGVGIMLQEPWRPVLALIILFFATFMIGILSSKLGDLRIPVFIYIGVIFLMGVAALQLPADGARIWVIIGAIMFIASDAILAFELFVWDENNPVKKVAAPTLWFLYWGGQALFVLGFLN